MSNETKSNSGMANTFRVGIIGTGMITLHGHLPAVLASDKADITALIDLNQSYASALADKFGITPRIAKSINEVADQVDGVIIATPNNTHLSLATECLNLKIPVLIEKPLATTVADGEKIVDAAHASQTVAAVGYCTRFDDNVAILDSLIEKKFFGKIHRWVYQLGVRDWAAPLTGYSFKRGAAGGGVLIVNGSHFLDRILNWFGFPVSTEYYDDSMGGPESTALANLQYNFNGAPMEGQIRLSKAFRLSNGFVMETDKGIVSLKEGEGEGITLRPSQSPGLNFSIEDDGSLKDNQGKGLFQRQLEDFIAACQQNTAPMVTAKEGLDSLKLIEQLYNQVQPLENVKFLKEQEVS